MYVCSRAETNANRKVRVMIDQQERSKHWIGEHCPDCDVMLGYIHIGGCDIERCSACHMQRIGCDCNGFHDPHLVPWTGFFPNDLEAKRINVCINDYAAMLMFSGWHKFMKMK